MKKIHLSILLLLCALCASQVQAASTINGMLVDARDTTALIAATVKLLKAGRDSTYVDGVVTDAKGIFNLKGVKPGHYIIKCSYLGYDNATRRVTVGTDGRDVNVGLIALDMSGKMLDEVVVQGVKTPITVKEDTIEYNADTYKTQANAVVEDVLKRLPGVEVGSDGKITANGKQVTKILIDGKEFFSDDPTVASKNIPAGMVDKLQVIDRKSDLARLTGVDDGDDETVINLTVKKGMNNGWFGTASAGYGTDGRWKGNLMANYFNSGNQYTLMAGGNNVNDLGFTDGGAGRFTRFGGANGVTKSQYLGFNFNVGTNDSPDGDHDKLRAGGDILYSHSDRDAHSTTARQYLFTDSTSYYNAMSSARDKGHNLRGDFRLQWRPDSANTIEFRPNFSFNFSKSWKADSSMTRAGDLAMSPVNRSLSSYYNDGKSYELAGQLVWTHNFLSHPGRSLSAQLRYSYSKVNEDGTTYTHNSYFLKSDDDQDQTIDQIYENHRRTNGVNGRITWTEPLGNVKRGNFITIAYSGNYRRSRASKLVYDITRDSTAMPAPGINDVMASMMSDAGFRSLVRAYYGNDALTTSGVVLASILDYELGPELERTFNESLSNRFSNTYYDQAVQVGLRKVNKNYNLNVGFTVNSAMSKSTDLIDAQRNIPARWAWSVAPFARLRYKFSKTRNLGFDYRMRSTQPSLTQLQPVADRSNPLNVTVGNPALKPTFTHRINLRYADFAQRAQRSIMAMIAASFSQNSIISKTAYDSSTGGRTTTYDNVNGVWNAMAMGMMSFPFTHSKVMYFTTNLMTRFAANKGYNNNQLNTSNTWTLNLSPGLAFRNGYFDIELRPRYSYQTIHNSLSTVKATDLHTYGGQCNASYTAPFGLMLSSDLSYSATSGYASGYNTKQWLWNASLGYSFLAGKQATLQVSVFDILNQRRNVSRNVTAAYVEDLAYNSLARYAMVTFTYKFSSFKQGEQPRDRNERRGPHGHNFGGRPPMGPPPHAGFGGE